MSYQEALQHYIAVTNSHDFNQVEPIVHPEAIYWFTEKSHEGVAAIRSYFEGTWDLIKDEVYTIDDVSWIATDEKVATCLYNYNWSGLYNGTFVKGSGRATNIFVNIDGVWKIIHEHLSPNK
jgi:ketosteroid isomerase-like protein